jgi:hypothetical protein
MPRFVPLGDSMIEIIRAAKAAGLGSDIKTLISGDAIALPGSSGRYADAAHQHPALITDSNFSEAIRGVVNVRLGVLASTGRIGFEGNTGTLWEIDNASDLLRFYKAGSPSIVAATISASVGGTGVAGMTLPAQASTSSIVHFLDPGGLGKWLYSSAGVLRVANSAFGVNILNLDDAGNFSLAGNLSLPAGNLSLPGGSSQTIGLSDSSGTPNKYLRANAGRFSILNSAASLEIFLLDDAGNVTLPAPSATLRFIDSSGTPNKYLRAASGQLQVLNSAATLILASVTDAGVLALPVSGGGLAVGAAGSTIPAIFVQAGTPTEIDGALWFQG